MNESLPYTDLIDEEWADKALETLSVVPSSDGPNPIYVDISGNCPRCNEHMEYTHWLVILAGVASMSKTEKIHAIETLRKAGIAKGDTLPAEFTVECGCKTVHPDQKGRTDLVGCGAKWRMRVEYT